MVGPGHEFDDIPDEQPSGPLLPPEDRLWRHPSEMSRHASDASPEVVEARNRWLAATPSRAGAWSAGLVGAVLATGVVLVGTHLTSWIGPRPNGSGPGATLTTVLRPTPGAGPLVEGPAGDAETVASGMALVEAVDRTTSRSGDGLVIRSDGMIVVPASVVEGATDVQVFTADPGGFDQQFDASIVGVDGATDVALLHADINGLTPTRFAPSGLPSAGQWMFFEWASPIRTVFSVAALSQAAIGARLGDGPGVLMSVRADVSGLPTDPVGAVMVDGRLQVTGMVTERNGAQFVEVPPAVLERVGDELIAYHQVRHGWLGITGVSARSGNGPMVSMNTNVTGVRVVSVSDGSSAARAGIRPGDVILAVNGQRVTTMADIQSLLYLEEPNEAVEVTVERGHTSWVCTPRLGAAG